MESPVALVCEAAFTGIAYFGLQYEKDNNAWKKLQMLIMQLRKCCNHPYLFPGAEPMFDGTTTGEDPPCLLCAARVCA